MKNKMLIKQLLILIAFLLTNIFTSLVFAVNLPQTEAVPGGVVVVDLGLNANQPNGKKPVVYFQKQRVMVAKNNDTWHGIVGIPLSTQAGKHDLHIKGANKTIKFNVNRKEYSVQRIKIKDKRKVNPTAEDLNRIRREKGRITRALKFWEDKEEIDTSFVLPVEGKLSSPFGLRRYFNEQPRKPHSGIDIAAPEGTPIKAPAAGKIIESGDFFFNGNSLFIDHGQGLITMYCHMSRINVVPGQVVAKGETIGAIGQTGRVTGPHLHWSVSLNNARIDPRLFFDNFDSLFNKKK